MSAILKMYRVMQRHDDGFSTIQFDEYNVVRQTEKTAWIQNNHKVQRVSKEDGLKQPFAFPTKKAALFSFIMRKKRQIRILNHHLKLIKKTLEIANDKHTINDFSDVDISHYDL